MSISVIIPALNEEDAIAKVVNDIPKQIVKEIIVVDNGSTDRTAAMAAAAGARVIKEPRRGYGNACLAGIRSIGPETDIVVFMDADYSDYPQELYKIVEPIRTEGYDMVIGSRLRRPENKMVINKINRLGNNIACWFMRNFFDASCTDLGPFRAIRRDSLNLLGMRDHNFGWTIEMQIKAALNDLRVKEVAVSYRKRIGHPKVTGTFFGSLKAFIKISYTVMKYGLFIKNGKRST